MQSITSAYCKYFIICQIKISNKIFVNRNLTEIFAFLQLLPYWDWTQFYKDGCLVHNPFFKGGREELQQEDCEVSHVS